MEASTFGAWCLVPPFIVIIVAIWTKRAFEPLLIGSIVGFLMIDRSNTFTLFTDSMTKALKDDSMVWIILVCGMYGAVIELLVRSGATAAFGSFVVRFIQNRRQALVATWAVGGLMFLDDYMSALSVGNTMKSVTDRFGISRASLAYIVNATAVPISVIVPLSTWSIYSGKIIAKEFGLGDTSWFDMYWNTIPFIFYGWVAAILAFLFALGFLPSKKMESITETTVTTNDIPTNDKAQFYDFFLPLVIIVAATVFFDIDALKGIYIGLAFTILYYWSRKLMTYNDIFEGGFDGFKSMLFALAILTATYILKDVGDKMGLTKYVIESIKPIVSKEYLAVLVFLSLSFISYTTASSWGLYLVAIPIVVPLANALGANIWLCLGAVISSGAFGSNASMYSDCTILTSNSCNINAVKHSLSQLPFALASVAIASLLYVILGFYL